MRHSVSGDINGTESGLWTGPKNTISSIKSIDARACNPQRCYDLSNRLRSEENPQRAVMEMAGDPWGSAGTGRRARLRACTRRCGGMKVIGERCRCSTDHVGERMSNN